MRDAFNWTPIDGGKILAGSLPTHAEDISSLKALGVKAILTLTRRNLDCPGMAEALVGIDHLHCPIPDGCAPDTLAWLTALQFMAQHEHGIMFVHCRQGVGRTGEILIAYYILCHHLSLIDAVEKVKIRHNGATGSAGDLSVPEQRAWVELLARGGYE